MVQERNLEEFHIIWEIVHRTWMHSHAVCFLSVRNDASRVSVPGHNPYTASFRRRSWCIASTALGLTTTREFLYTKLCPEKSHPLLRLNVPWTSHDILENQYTNPFSSLAYYFPVVFFGTHFLTLLDYHQALKLLNHVTCLTLCADWLVLHAIFRDCNQPETFYHIVSPTYHAFTHLMFAAADFIAPCIQLHSCLSHITFDV